MAKLQRDFVKIQNDFTIIPNEILRNKEMKPSTKDILLTMFSLPPDWDFSIAGISKVVYEGKETVQKALVELEKIGYITRKRERKDGGTFGAMIYTIHQFPVSEEENTYKKNFCDNQDVKNQKQVFPKQESETQYNTNNISNTDCSIGDTENNKNDLDNIDLLSTDNSLSNDKDNSKDKSFELHNSQVSEKHGSRISMSLGVKQKQSKEITLKDMPTRAKEIADSMIDDVEFSDGVFQCISYFLEKYKQKNHKEHLSLKNDTLERVVEVMLSTLTVEHDEDLENEYQTVFYPLVCYESDWDDRKKVIDKYFETKFNYFDDYGKRINVDCSLVHFTQKEVITHVMQKCYRGSDANWYESEPVN